MAVKIHDRISWRGRIRVRTRNVVTGREEVQSLDNLIVNPGLNMARDFLRGTQSDGQIKYMGWGDSTTAVSSTQAALGNEAGRKAITSRSSSGPGVLVTTTYLAPAEAVGTIGELGWFASTGATAVADSGIMLARVLYSKVKTELESITVDRIDSFGSTST
jgi:hypothetical protein